MDISVKFIDPERVRQIVNICDCKERLIGYQINLSRECVIFYTGDFDFIGRRTFTSIPICFSKKFNIADIHISDWGRTVTVGGSIFSSISIINMNVV